MYRRPKYVAEGFAEDAGKLLTEFLELNSVDFTDFATVWRNNHFSLIFMGRPDETEMCEFVNEMYRITTKYLFTESFNQQVGAIFLLYALYRNQISVPPIQIRLELDHWKVIRSVRTVAIEKKYLTLHYVIDYLMEHAFLYVLHQTLRGPLTRPVPNASEHDVVLFKAKKELNEGFLEYSASNSLSTLKDLKEEYLNSKKEIEGIPNVCVSNTKVYDEALKDMEKLAVEIKEDEEYEKVLYRRSKMMTKVFKKETKNNVISDKEGECSKDQNRRRGRPSNAETKKTGRVPKGERKLGRPRKNKSSKTPEEPVLDEDDVDDDDDDDEIDISHLIDQQKDFYLPPELSGEKKNRTKHQPYYALPPKSNESDTDSDDGDYNCAFKGFVN